MRVPAAVATSDCHLQTYNWAKYPELRFDSFYSFEQTVTAAIDHDVPLLLGGDVFQRKQVDSPTLGATLDQMDRLEAAEVPCMYIQGQHEMDFVRPWLSCHRWPQHVDRKLFTIGKQTLCYGLDFRPKTQCLAELAKIPAGTALLMAHQVWRERMGDKACPEAAFADVPVVRYLITGDFHGHRTDIFPGKTHNIFVASPGSTYQKTIDEDDRKFFYYIKEEDDVLHFTSVGIDTRQCLRACAWTQHELDTLIEQLAEFKPRAVKDERIAKPIWNVRLMSTIPDGKKRLSAAAEGRAFLFLDIKDPDDQPEEADKLDTSDEVVLRPGVESALPSVADPDSKVFDTILRLVRANDTPSAKAVISQVKEEFLTDFIEDE